MNTVTQLEPRWSISTHRHPKSQILLDSRVQPTSSEGVLSTTVTVWLRNSNICARREVVHHIDTLIKVHHFCRRQPIPYRFQKNTRSTARPEHETSNLLRQVPLFSRSSYKHRRKCTSSIHTCQHATYHLSRSSQFTQTAREMYKLQTHCSKHISTCFLLKSLQVQSRMLR